MPLNNTDIAEWLALTGETAEGERRRVYGRAARAALTWTEEVAHILETGRALTDLYMVGPRLARRITGWVEAGEAPPEPPASRRGFISVAQARSVVELSGVAVRGDLQMHSEYSDGSESVETMARASAALGYEYIAITDHSQGLKIAKGMSVSRLNNQIAEVAELNKRTEHDDGVAHVLQGIEMNLDTRGEGDMPPESLAGLDLVLGSFHSALRVTDDQTPRYLRAVANPYIDVLAHPRGRKFNQRRGLPADWNRVFETATEHGVAFEINSYPDRQDLHIELLQLARDYDLYFTIGTDAHATWELDFMIVGMASAILAGIPTERILNYRSAQEIRNWVADRRR